MSCLDEEALAFLKQVKMTRAETRDTINKLFQTAPQNRKRDLALMEKLLIQTPAAITMSDTLVKEAAALEEMSTRFEEYHKTKVAFNVSAFFEQGFHLNEAQRRFPELAKLAAKHAINPAKDNCSKPSFGTSSSATSVSNANK